MPSKSSWSCTSSIGKISFRGVCVFGGPVFDPKGVYGVLAIRAATEDEARALASADPSVKAGLNRIEVRD